MLLWSVFAALTAVAVVGAALPLSRGVRGEHRRADYDLEVYRHQLDELRNDLERGTISATEEAAARTEIERRILATGATDEPRPHATPTTPRLVGVMAAAIGIPALASGLYLHLGSPQPPDRPPDDRSPAAARQAPADGLRTAVDRLQARLARGSGSLADWLLLGRSYAVLRRFDDAAEAYRRADGLRPDDPDIMTALGEALVLAADGMVTPEAETVFRRVHALDGGLPGPRFYMGLARAQAGDPQDAYDIWLALASDSEPDAPWLPRLIVRLEEMGAGLGKDVAAELRDAATGRAAGDSVPARGPTREDAEAAAGMSAGDRAEMIRGMVAGLAERLEENPEDVQGWIMLARSYRVLGQPEKAREALRRAQAAAQERKPARAPARRSFSDLPVP